MSFSCFAGILAPTGSSSPQLSGKFHILGTSSSDKGVLCLRVQLESLPGKQHRPFSPGAALYMHGRSQGQSVFILPDVLVPGSLASSDVAIGSMKGRMWTCVSHQYIRPCSHHYLSVTVPSSRWMFPRMICISSSWSSPSRPAVASPAQVVPLGLSWGRGLCQA